MVTIGSLIVAARKVDKTNVISRVNTFELEFDKVVDRLQLDDLCDEIKRGDKLETADIEILATAYKRAFKRITGANISINIARSMVVKNNNTNITTGFQHDISADIPDWCNEWVFVMTSSRYFNLHTRKSYSSVAFNIEAGKHIPRVNDKGSKISAAKYVADDSLIEIVDQEQYMPCFNDALFTRDAIRYVNTFNPSTFPQASESHTEDGLKVVEMIKRHIKLLFRTDDQAEIMMQWLAWQRQRKGVKIMWAPLIQGFQGVGKSFFSVLLEQLIGDVNVGKVQSPSNDFNGWAKGVCVNVLEELKITGQNRYEVLNALKPLITDSKIQINDKNVSQYQSINITN
jgi:hypothetical protein